MSGQYEIRRTLDVPLTRWNEPVGSLLFTVDALEHGSVESREKAFDVARTRAEAATKMGYPCRVVFVDWSSTNYRSWCAWSQKNMDGSPFYGERPLRDGERLRCPVCGGLWGNGATHGRC